MDFSKCPVCNRPLFHPNTDLSTVTEESFKRAMISCAAAVHQATLTIEDVKAVFPQPIWKFTRRFKNIPDVEFTRLGFNQPWFQHKKAWGSYARRNYVTYSWGQIRSVYPEAR
jgi:hypothetical protein